MDKILVSPNRVSLRLKFDEKFTLGDVVLLDDYFISHVKTLSDIKYALRSEFYEEMKGWK
jgi:hypothetical protein